MDFTPIIRSRNYAPIRTFVTKWEHEQVKTAKKKRERRSEYDYKYTDQRELTNDILFMTWKDDPYSYNKEVFRFD